MATVTAAQARDFVTVRVTFDAGLADLTADATGALNPENWSFVGQPTDVIPTAEVTAVSVVSISSSIFDVVVSEEFSFGVVYLVVAKAASAGGITGVADAPNDRAAFATLAPEEPAGRDFNIPDMIPRMNFSEDDSKDLERFANVLQDLRTVLLNQIDRWTDILDLDVAPENFLDLMLQELGYPFDFALSVLDKRRLLAILVPMYQQKGTARGIRNTIRFFLGYESDILWLDKSGDGGWILDDSLLDDNTILGAGTSYTVGIHGSDMAVLFNDARAYNFVVKVGKGTALTADETYRVQKIIEANRLHQNLLAIESVLTSPANLTVTPGVGQLTLSWSAVAGATDYVVFWDSTPRVSTTAANGIVYASSPRIQAVTTGEKRYYVVAARNASGIVGVGSTIVSGTAL